MYALPDRVTRLVELSPIMQLFIREIFMQMTGAAGIAGYFLSTVKFIF
jgi:hypothetical protein